MTTDEKYYINQLVKNIAHNDNLSLEILYKKMYKVLYCFLNTRCKNKSLIEDIIEDTFIVIIKKCNKIIYNNCYNWILTIAQKTMMNHLRNKNNNFCSIDNVKESYFENDNDIKFVINKLQPIEQQIIYLKYYCGLNLIEISKILKLSLSTVKRKYKESMRFLKEKING